MIRPSPTPRRRHAVVAALALTVLLAVSANVAGTPPPGFVETLVMTGDGATGASPAVAVAYEPGSGHLWVLEKGAGTAEGTARVRRRDAVTSVVSTALDLGCVDSRGERGLLGIAFSPDYLDPGGANRFVYLYYTRKFATSGPCQVAGHPSESRNRVSRFLESGGVLSGEEVVLDGPALTSATNHNGGTLRFAPDGTLFVSVGDNNTDADANPLSRDLGDFRGKMLRIHADGSVPDDNPFVDVAGAAPEVWAWGLRNPFRFGIDSDTGAPVIGDVGEGTWEAIYVGVPQADYGYPCVEGVAPFRTCNPAPPEGTVTGPALVYGHGNQTPPVSGNSVTGGPVYRHDAFPDDYHGTYFFGDFVDGWIRRGRITEDGRLVDVEMFMPDANSVVDIIVSPAGCLTWVSIGGDGVREVCPESSGNHSPTARASADPVAGLAPLDVQFTGSQSTDPDNDTLAHAWDFGDGNGSSQADPAHTYALEGFHDAVLTVDDGQMEPDSVDAAPPVRIVVGNEPPSISIDAPVAGTTYDAGETIAYGGSADDPQEGTLGPEGFAWTIAFQHGGVTQPFLGPITGVSSGQFTIPTRGEDATDVFFRIHLRVTDSGAPLGAGGEAASSTFVDVTPNVSTITLEAMPLGFPLELEIDGSTAVAPVSLDSVVNFSRTLRAPSPQNVGGQTFEFVSWSDGGAAEHVIATPAADTTFTARFACVPECTDLDADGDGFTPAEGDCDDTETTVRPGAPEVCDQADNDCDGGVDDAMCSDFDGTGDGRVDGVELASIGRAFGSCSATPATEWWAFVNYNGDDCVDGDDLWVLSTVWKCSAGGPACE